MKFSINRFYGVWLGMMGGFNLGLAFGPPFRILNAIGGGIIILIAIPRCWEPKPHVPQPHFEIPDFEPPIAVYQNQQGVWDIYPPIHHVATLQPTEATDVDLWSSRYFEGKMMGKKHLKADLWWHCYGGITTADCSWGEGHYCMVILGESPKTSDEIPENIDAAGTWATPLMYLKSFDHDPTEQEKQKLTPVEYRDLTAREEMV